MNVINGELRTATELMNHYKIQNYKYKYFEFRLFNKIAPYKCYKVKYEKMPTDTDIKLYLLSYPKDTEKMKIKIF